VRFFASLYVQDILGYSPLRAGFAFLPVTGRDHRRAAALAQQLIRRIGVRNVAVAGNLDCAAVGLIVLTRVAGARLPT